MGDRITVAALAVAGLPTPIFVAVAAGLVVAVIIVLAVIYFTRNAKKGNAATGDMTPSAGSEPWQRQSQAGAQGGWGQQPGQMNANPQDNQWGQQAQAGGWGAQNNPAQGGWGTPAQNNPASQPGGWGAQPQQANAWNQPAEPTAQPGGWGTPAQNNPASQPGGWGAQPQQANAWNQPAEPTAQPGGWGTPAQNNPASQPGGWGAQPQQAGSQDAWNQPQPQPQPQQGSTPGWGAPNKQQPGFGSPQPWSDPNAQQQQPVAQNAWGQPQQQSASGNLANPGAPAWQQPGSSGLGAGGFGNPAAQDNATVFGGDVDKTLLRGAPGQQTGQGIGFVRVEEGKEVGRIYEVRKPSLSIGRSRESDIFLEDLAVSRLHASIVDLGNNNYAVKDEGSANGTKVNGQLLGKYQTYNLQEGDRVQLGQTVLVFSRR